MASRKEEKEQRRQERLAREADADQEGRRRRTYGIVAGTVLVLGVVAAIGLILVGGGGGDSTDSASANTPTAEYSGASKPPSQTTTDLFAAAKKAGCTLKNPAVAGRTHIDSSKKVVYATNPPTSGDHDAVPEPDGVYTVYPQPRHVVHALEGGRVVVQYRPSALTKQQRNELGGVYNEDSLYLLMFPNPTMSYAVAVSAWGHFAGCKKVNAATYDVIRAFIDRYRDQAPEPAASHQAAAGQTGWPGQIPPPHENGNIPGS